MFSQTEVHEGAKTHHHAGSDAEKTLSVDQNVSYDYSLFKHLVKKTVYKLNKRPRVEMVNEWEIPEIHVSSSLNQRVTGFVVGLRGDARGAAPLMH